MKVYIEGHNFNYETEKLCRIFLPFEKIEFVAEGEWDAAVVRKRSDKGYKLYSALKLNNKLYELTEEASVSDDKEHERILAVLLYRCFCELTGYSSRWGILTGVRPAKLFSKMSKEIGIDATVEYFRNKLLVSEEKIQLCQSAIAGEGEITGLSKPDSFSLYIGIPFCPSRCSYCSFVSHSVEQAKKLIPEYVELLCREIEETGRIARECGLRLETVYIGGGTPTTLSAEQLTRLMDTVKNSFDLLGIREYTVEAGRPDTVTRDKLVAIKAGGATRISINPQTMNDSVLEKIGRRHTSAQTVEAMELAREVGFDNINMDLIAGLPSDTLESFRHTIDEILKLTPESVTIHTLCMKRSATLNVEGEFPELKVGEVATKMLDYGKSALHSAGLEPYYMYRQSKMVGNLENVGYSKKGYEGLYNVYIMDETHTILACGASAVTKLRSYGENLIERVYNFKYPYEYISRFEEQLQRKEAIKKFYNI